MACSQLVGVSKQRLPASVGRQPRLTRRGGCSRAQACAQARLLCVGENLRRWAGRPWVDLPRRCTGSWRPAPLPPAPCCRARRPRSTASRSTRTSWCRLRMLRWTDNTAGASVGTASAGAGGARRVARAGPHLTSAIGLRVGRQVVGAEVRRVGVGQSPPRRAHAVIDDAWSGSAARVGTVYAVEGGVVTKLATARRRGAHGVVQRAEERPVGSCHDPRRARGERDVAWRC